MSQLTRHEPRKELSSKVGEVDPDCRQDHLARVAVQAAALRLEVDRALLLFSPYYTSLPHLNAVPELGTGPSSGRLLLPALPLLPLPVLSPPDEASHDGVDILLLLAQPLLLLLLHGVQGAPDLLRAGLNVLAPVDL